MVSLSLLLFLSLSPSFPRSLSSFFSYSLTVPLFLLSFFPLLSLLLFLSPFFSFFPFISLSFSLCFSLIFFLSFSPFSLLFLSLSMSLPIFFFLSFYFSLSFSLSLSSFPLSLFLPFSHLPVSFFLSPLIFSVLLGASRCTVTMTTCPLQPSRNGLKTTWFSQSIKVSNEPKQHYLLHQSGTFRSSSLSWYRLRASTRVRDSVSLALSISFFLFLSLTF